MNDEHKIKNDTAVIEAMWERIDNAKAQVNYLTEGAACPTDPETLFTEEGRALCSARRIIECLTIERDALLLEVSEQKEAIRSAIERAKRIAEEEENYNYFSFDIDLINDLTTECDHEREQ